MFLWQSCDAFMAKSGVIQIERKTLLLWYICERNSLAVTVSLCTHFNFDQDVRIVRREELST